MLIPSVFHKPNRTPQTKKGHFWYLFLLSNQLHSCRLKNVSSKTENHVVLNQNFKCFRVFDIMKNFSTLESPEKYPNNRCDFISVSSSENPYQRECHGALLVFFALIRFHLQMITLCQV